MIEKEIYNWGRYPTVKANISSLHYCDELSDVIERTPCIARGNGRCYGDASLSENVISTLGFSRILSFDKESGELHCQSGILFSDILQLIVPDGWFLPVTPGTKFITVGGAVASDVHGKNHHCEGSFREHIINLKLFCSNGGIIDCNQQQNKQLFDATCGGMGLTGLIISVHFRLKKIETSYINRVQEKASNLDEVLSLFEKYNEHTYSMAWIDCLKGGRSFGRSIMMAGEHTSAKELAETGKSELLNLPSSGKLSVPFNLPEFCLSKTSVRIFNQLYFHKTIKKHSSDIIHFDPFFYPLDSIHHWNRMYGKKGFLQYQFVLPIETSRRGLIEILEKIRKQDLGSFLAVLKLFGKQNGIMSFPMPGYTLALDFPVQKGVFDFLNKLDELVLKHNGRLYLSKDARMNSKVFKESYPNYPEFVKTIDQYNPNRIYSSHQSKRLNI